MPEWGPGSDADEAPDGDGGGVFNVYWGNLVGVPQSIRKFATAPVSFILGALLSVLVGGIETVIAAFLRAFGALANAFVAVPRSAARILQQAGGSTGDTLLSAITGVLGTFEGAAASAGPLAPLLAGVALALTIVVAAYAARFAWTLLVDSINPL